MPSRRGIYRAVYCSLVGGPDFQALSADARHVLLTARVSEEAGPGCIWRRYPGVLEAQTGRPVKVVEKALGELTATGWTEQERGVLWIVNGLRHDPTIRLTDPLHRKNVARWLLGLPRLSIVARFCSYYNLEAPSGTPQGPQEDPHATDAVAVAVTGSRKTLLCSPAEPDPASELREQAISVLEHLNRLTGRRFQPEPGSLDPIMARLRAGATVRECKGVVSQRCQKWRGDAKMAEYLRPKTLFSPTNFASYRADLPADDAEAPA